MLTQLRPALVMITAMTLLTGLAYPLAMTGVSQVLFPYQANGSLVSAGGAIAGSMLVAQNFTDPGYFHPRPSAANYDGAASTGSNLGPTSAALKERLATDSARLSKQSPGAPVPVDLVTTSGSGLDPHISPQGAAFQLARVAKARGLDAKVVSDLVNTHTEGPSLAILGEPRVNVLGLNLALDALARRTGPAEPDR